MQLGRMVPALVCALLGALVLAGCDGATKTVTPTAYVSAVCSALRPFESEVAARASALDPAHIRSPAAGRTALVGFLAAVGADARAIMRETEQAGTPNVTNGHRIATTLTGVFTRLSSALDRATSEAKALPTSSVRAFELAETRLVTGVKASFDDLGSGVGELKNAAVLSAAAKKAAACQAVG